MKKLLNTPYFKEIFDRSGLSLKSCYWDCVSLFFPFIILFIIIDQFFWENNSLLYKIHETSATLFQVVDNGIYVILLFLLKLVCLMVLKYIHIREDGESKAQRKKAVAIVWKLTGSIVATMFRIYFKTALFSLLLIVPGVIFYFLSGFALVINVLEEENSKTSLERSVELIKKNWKRYFGVTVFITLFWFALTYTISDFIISIGDYLSINGYFIFGNLSWYLALFFMICTGVLALSLYYALYIQLKNKEQNES